MYLAALWYSNLALLMSFVLLLSGEIYLCTLDDHSDIWRQLIVFLKLDAIFVFVYVTVVYRVK